MQNLAFSSADFATAAAGVAVVKTYAADGPGRSHVISGVAGGYDTAPTNGKLTIEDGAGNIVFQEPITAAGPFEFMFDIPRQGSPNTALVITLAAGGGGVTGFVNALSHFTTGSKPIGAPSLYGASAGVEDFSDPGNSGYDF